MAPGGNEHLRSTEALCKLARATRWESLLKFRKIFLLLFLDVVVKILPQGFECRFELFVRRLQALEFVEKFLHLWLVSRVATRRRRLRILPYCVPLGRDLLPVCLDRPCAFPWQDIRRVPLQWHGVPAPR
jgi:hypothetical protein